MPGPSSEEVRQRWEPFDHEERNAIIQALRLYIEEQRRIKPGDPSLPVSTELLGQLEFVEWNQ